MARTTKKKTLTKAKKAAPKALKKSIVKKPSAKITLKKAIKKTSTKKTIAKKSAVKAAVKKGVVKKVITKKALTKKAVAQKPMTILTLKKPAPVTAPAKIVVSAVKPTVTPVKPTVVTAAPKVPAPTTIVELSVGSKAPAFSMPATLLETVSGESLKGKPYVLYFYPKDDTSGCTAEACEFRNTLPHFSSLGVAIVGVSKDNLESHEKFSRKYSLTFPLASDTTSVCESFGTWVQKSMYGRTYMGIERSTFLVDGEGFIRAIWRKVSVPGHVEDVRKAIESL